MSDERPTEEVAEEARCCWCNKVIDFSREYGTETHNVYNRESEGRMHYVVYFDHPSCQILMTHYISEHMMSVPPAVKASAVQEVELSLEDLFARGRAVMGDEEVPTKGGAYL